MTNNKNVSKLVKTENGSTFAVQVLEDEKKEAPVVAFRSMDGDSEQPLRYDVQDFMQVTEKPLVIEGIVPTKLDWKQVQSLQSWVKRQVDRLFRYA